jgi:diaminopimelate epimerase
LHRYKGVSKNFTFDTLAGRIGIGLLGGRISVDMGRPILDGRKIPTRGTGEIVNRTLKAGGKSFKIHSVSMGNPHCVIYVKDVKNFPVQTYGPLIENHPFFPKRVNVEFVQILNRQHARVRVWERGAGETLACGTGACAVLVASARAGKTGRNAAIDLPGGRLTARWANNGRVYLSGPAQISYEGEFYV